MSSLWREAPAGGWEAIPLPPGRPGEISEGPLPGIAFVGLGGDTEGGTGLLVRAGVPVRVNGQPVAGGFRVLDHRDEILVGRNWFYFSVESTPVRVAFPAEHGARLSTCPVCRGPLAEGVQAVRCPGCGRWYHQLDAAEGGRARPCWTYAATCRFCNHPTALSGQDCWRPEKEEAHA